MIDRRQHRRQRTCLGGLIVFKGGLAKMDCLVRNTSSGGAKLALPQTILIPQEFILDVVSKQVKMLARVEWIRPGECGVKFLT